MNNIKVDVSLTAYGKPYQTAVTLFSLLEHNQNYINKIWLHEEPQHIYNNEISFILPWFKDNLVHYKPPYFLGSTGNIQKCISDSQYRLSVRYQKPFEESEMDYLFICHNDTFFTDDIIKQMLDKLEDSPYVAVGEIGQCWNCPAKTANLCDGDRHEQYKPTYQEVMRLISKVPSPRTKANDFNPNDSLQIMPECRLNEFACLLNLKKCRPYVLPKGNVLPIGLMISDTGTEFFKGMRRHECRFLNYRGNHHHAKFSPIGNGHSLECKEQVSNYWQAEENAKQYLNEHYNDKIK